LAWPHILSGKHTIVADQTGSGKTLAYLLPLLQRALQTPPTKSKYGAPKVLILAPTAELADQIRTVCAKISKTVPFKTMVVTATGKGTTSIRDQIRMIQRQPIDVLISTPGRVSTILRTRNSGLDLAGIQSIVLDEVDILLIDETFGPQLRAVGEAAPMDKTQFVFVTATLPDSIVTTVETEFPGVVQVRGPGLHRVAPTVKEQLVDVSVPAESNRDAALCFDIKAKQLLKALRQNRCRRTLVFCNTVDSCRTVENLLNRKDRRGQVFEVGAYHNAMTPEARNANMQIFAKGGNKPGGSGNDDDVDYVLICTDRAARGVDFDSAPVDHVVIFDFPKDPAEYVRRVGRTARAGRTGATTVFAYGWQLPIAKNVMGSKLDSYTIAANEMGDDDDKYEFRRAHRKQKKAKDVMIKGNIEGGRVWGD
jgi:ATP-dependent RNA helicase DDX18/HAS1